MTKKIPESQQGLDLQFFTKNYKITPDDKKSLAQLTMYPEFRVFEKYLDWRVNASAHRMKQYLDSRSDNFAASEASSIDALIKITTDMYHFYQESKGIEDDKGIQLGKEGPKAPKAFGIDAVDILQQFENDILI